MFTGHKNFRKFESGKKREAELSVYRTSSTALPGIPHSFARPRSAALAFYIYTCSSFGAKHCRADG
jgi:hypothetical protein